MATEKETVILDFQVEQGSAITELEKTKKSIILLKEEQQQLNAAYKKGVITVDEYADESVRLEGVLKKQQSTYNNVQKSVTGVKTQMDKLIDSNKKISASFADAANNINVAGVNVGQLGQKLSSLAGPAGIMTAAVGVVGALGAAYARSTVGAKDLEFAQNQLGIATGLLSNKFADLINTSNEDGEGLFTNILNGIIGRIDMGLAVESKVLALIQEQIEDLQRAEITARTNVSDRLADNQEILTQIQDSQTDYLEKLHLTFEMVQNITKNEDELLAIKNEQLRFAQAQLDADKENENKQKVVLELNREISNIQKDAERRRQGVLRLESNLTDQYQKQLQAQKDLADQQAEEKRKEARKGVTERGAGGSGIVQEQVDTNFKILAENATRELKLYEDTEAGKQDLAQRSADFKKALNEQELAQTAAILNSAATLFGEQTVLGKTLGIANATINTYQGATLALGTLPPPASYIAAAVTIASGLASVAKIAGVDTGVAAAGGTDFVTSKPTMLLVGDNPGGREHVQVTPLSGKGKTRTFGRNGIAMAGGGSLTVDGGAAKNAATSEINQTLAFTNALKSMPTPVVSVKEITKTQRRVVVKEQISRA